MSWFRRPAQKGGDYPPGVNYPENFIGTGQGGQPPVPKGLQAPEVITFGDENGLLDQRRSELLQTGRINSLQTWLRQRRTVQVTPLEVDANHLYAPLQVVAPGGVNRDHAGYSQSASTLGMYRVDYSLQTQMGQVPGPGRLSAPLRPQSVPGYVDATTQVIINGQYSQINSNLAQLYQNMRAPSPWEGLQACP